ncbi:MAG: hypothetical protein AAGF47_11975 [Planctomycetota bacterium]
MPKGQNLSAHQQKIVKRYYDNADTITITKLQELVTEIYLATADGSAKKLDTLWKRAGDHLAKTSVGPGAAKTIVNNRDVEKLAEVLKTAHVKKR